MARINLLQNTITSKEKLLPTPRACAREESMARAKAEHQIVALGNKIDEAERQLADYKTKISALEKEKQHDKTKDHLRDCQTQRDQLEKENGSLRLNISKLALVQDSLAACRAKKDKLEKGKETLTAEFDKLEQTRQALAADLDRLRVEASTSRDGEQQLAAEFSAANSSLKKCRADLALERGRNTTLKEQVSSLELSHAELMESISACWLHKFWAWVSGNGGASKGSASEAMSRETALQIAKV
jgi:chromosome segregation ATPase